MPLPHASKAVSSREKLLRAANALFAVKGFHGTSTRDLARRARVNETTIFRLFKNKKELYVSVLERNMGASDIEWLQSLLQSSQDDGEVFEALARRLQELMNPEFMRLVFFAALENPDLLRKHFRARTVHFYKLLSQHIQKRIDCGVLKNLDPDLMGRAFVAMIAYHEVLILLMGGPEFEDDVDSEWMKVYTNLWLHGALENCIPDKCPDK